MVVRLAGEPLCSDGLASAPTSRCPLERPGTARSSTAAGRSWVHDTSATPARVLWRWDNVMASSALRSALRSTACMQAVNLKTKLRLRSTGAVDDQSGTAAQLPAYQGLDGGLRACPGSAIGRAPAAVGWPLQAGAPAGPAQLRGQRPCDGTFPRADRWPTGAGTWSRHHQP